jgi:hypothetical protein
MKNLFEKFNECFPTSLLSNMDNKEINDLIERANLDLNNFLILFKEVEENTRSLKKVLFKLNKFIKD